VRDDGLEAYVEALLMGRPSRQFLPSSEEILVLRPAIALRNAAAVLAAPDPRFVERLHGQLVGDGRQPSTRDGPRRAARSGSGWQVPRRESVGKAAAAALLLAGLVGVGAAVARRSPARGARRALSANVVRSAELRSGDGRPLGRAYAYSGKPSWVFMDVRSGALSGVYICELHLADGDVVPAGEVAVYNGIGDWGHTVAVDVSQLRQAALVGTFGAVVATARFR
jgi:hypothetical protein